MGVPLRTIIQYLEELAPPQRAQSWDKIGLQVGDRHAQINCMLVALDASEVVAEQAVNAGTELIVTHHPLIFSPLNRLVWQEAPSVRLLRKLIQANINLYVAHTNLDASSNGASNLLADLLQLRHREPFATVVVKTYKLVVFVPQEAVQPVRLAIGEAGAGVIGAYSYCSFQTDGVGVFQAADTANPYMGKPGELSLANEVRLETVVSDECLKDVLKVLKQAHPYEEVAYDLYPVQGSNAKHGLGVVGDLPQRLKLSQLTEQLQSNLNLNGLRWVGKADQIIERIAVCGGGGGDLVAEAQKTGAQALISGDFKYHQAREAEMLQLAILDVGHFSPEYLAMQNLAENLKNRFQEEGQSVNILTCQEEVDPFHYYYKRGNCES